MYSRRHARRSAVLAAAALSSVPLSAALDNGVMRPHMGWSTWNTLRTNFNESILRDVADAIVATGMVGSGYSVLAIDDSWPLPKRAADGSIVVNPALFPSGMRALATYLSARGMSLGIYTAHCALTCLGFPGSLGHEAQDAATYASWPATYVKNDYCIYSGGGGCNDTEAFSAMRDALNATGQRITYNIHYGNSVCMYPRQFPLALPGAVAPHPSRPSPTAHRPPPNAQCPRPTPNSKRTLHPANRARPKLTLQPTFVPLS